MKTEGVVISSIGMHIWHKNY